MANLILSISDQDGSNTLKLPGLQNYVQDIGVKKDANIALTTEEGCKNFELPFVIQRDIEVAENSVVSGVIDVDRRIRIINSGVYFQLGAPVTGGIKIEVSADFSSGEATVRGIGGGVLATLPYGSRAVFISTRALTWERLFVQATNIPTSQPNSNIGAIWLS